MMSIGEALRALRTLGKGTIGGLDELRAGSDPIALFREWFEAAASSGVYMPEAMTLATATPDGMPSARMVLLKGFDARGFVFFTNYGSRKASELDANPRAALCLHWAALQRQVRIEGAVSRVSEDESAAYFRTRPRGSRIGAWASKQSEPLNERATLEAAVAKYERDYPDDDVPLPPFWGGYRVSPERIEFWQGRANRLHDRLVYERGADGWIVTRLYP
jgi:pyridoxamine 5'-phosphate oxidase